jgi:ATP-dependent HslUV protease subunit HslV
MLIANASGIYGLYSYREVFEFKEFWGIGSGRSFALGAMHAAYDKVQDRARSGGGRHRRRLRVRRNSAPPVDIFTLKLKASK